MLRALANKILPARQHSAIQRKWRILRYIGFKRTCPICSSHLRLFLPHGVILRPNAVCPVCQSRDRHRLAWLYLQRETPLLTASLSFLHLAPEPELARRLAGLPNIHYVSGDLVHRAMAQMDICRLPLRNDNFDMLYCSHVLNMLPDDRPAMAELRRVIKPGGLALVQVPQSGQAETVEAGAGSTRERRVELFSDPDMYRRYGKDIFRRLTDAGFLVQVVPYYHQFSRSEQIRLGLIDEDLYICRRPE